jgi:hypothetical protein
MYANLESGEIGGALPAGEYDVVVDDVRFKIKDDRSKSEGTFFLSLKVLNGPSVGEVTDVNLVVPNSGSKQFAHEQYLKKLNGFQGPDLKAAFLAAENAPTIQEAFTVVGDALKGKTVRAALDAQKSGQYVGRQELKSTRPLQESIQTEAPELPKAENVITDNGQVTQFIEPPAVTF